MGQGSRLVRVWHTVNALSNQYSFALHLVHIHFQVLSALVFMLAVIFGFGAGGWIAFAAFYVAVEEIIAVIVRFINPGLIWQRPAIPLIFVSCLGSCCTFAMGLCALLLVYLYIATRGDPCVGLK